MTVFGSYVVLTEPVPELLAKIGWTGGEGIYDSRMFLHYFRTTDDGRVLMGSGSGPIGYGARIDRRFTHDAATAARAERGLRRLLPGLAGAKVGRLVGRPHRRLGRPSAVHRHRSRHASPLRARLLRARCRPDLARRPGARLPRRRPRRRMDSPAARRPPGRACPARAVPADRRRRDPRLDPRLRGGGGGTDGRAPLLARVGAFVPRALGLRLGQR